MAECQEPKNGAKIPQSLSGLLFIILSIIIIIIYKCHFQRIFGFGPFFSARWLRSVYFLEVVLVTKIFQDFQWLLPLTSIKYTRETTNAAILAHSRHVCLFSLFLKHLSCYKFIQCVKIVLKNWAADRLYPLQKLGEVTSLMLQPN